MNSEQSSATFNVNRDIDEIMCDGGHSTLGHPAVFYSFEDSLEITCGYCGRKFVKDSD